MGPAATRKSWIWSANRADAGHLGEGHHRREEALIEMYKRLRPGEPPTRRAPAPFSTLFYRSKRYDLAGVAVTRSTRSCASIRALVGRVPVEHIVHPETGEVLVEAGEDDHPPPWRNHRHRRASTVVVPRGTAAWPFQNHQERRAGLMRRTITAEDIVAAVNYIVGLTHGIGTWTTSTTWATGGCGRWVNCCRTSSVSVYPAWSGWSGSA